MTEEADPPSSLGQRLLKKTTTNMPAALPEKSLSQQFLRRERPASVQTQQGLDATALESYKESLAKRIDGSFSQQGMPAQAVPEKNPEPAPQAAQSPPAGMSLSREIAAPYVDTVPLAAQPPFTPPLNQPPSAQPPLTQPPQTHTGMVQPPFIKAPSAASAPQVEPAAAQQNGAQMGFQPRPTGTEPPHQEKPVRPERAPDATTRAGSHIWFDASGLIETVATATNQIFRFQYDEMQRITTVLEPDGALVLNSGNGVWVRHLPTGGSNTFTGMVTVKPSSDIEYHMLLPDGGELLTAWSPAGNIANLRKAVIKHPLTANAIEAMLLVGVTDRLGVPVSIDYDEEGNPIRIVWGKKLLIRAEDLSWIAREGEGEAYRFGGAESVVRELNGSITIHSSSGDLILSRYGVNA